jgi:glutathione peroxidase-family protein
MRKSKWLEPIETNLETILEAEERLITGEKVYLRDFCKGKKCILVVNVATNWWQSSAINFKELMDLHEKFESEGL